MHIGGVWTVKKFIVAVWLIKAPVTHRLNKSTTTWLQNLEYCRCCRRLLHNSLVQLGSVCISRRWFLTILKLACGHRKLKWLCRRVGKIVVQILYYDLMMCVCRAIVASVAGYCAIHPNHCRTVLGYWKTCCATIVQLSDVYFNPASHDTVYQMIFRG